MSEKYKIRDQERLYFLTFSVVQWINVSVQLTILVVMDYYILSLLNRILQGSNFRAREGHEPIVLSIPTHHSWKLAAISTDATHNKYFVIHTITGYFLHLLNNDSR
jgi:hypothetical protein